jgi:hypothetical protein
MYRNLSSFDLGHYYLHILCRWQGQICRQNLARWKVLRTRIYRIVCHLDLWNQPQSNSLVLELDQPQIWPDSLVAPFLCHSLSQQHKVLQVEEAPELRPLLDRQQCFSR